MEYKIDDVVDAVDADSVWTPAVVLNVHPQKGYRVHYLGWSSSLDRWVGHKHVAPAHSYTHRVKMLAGFDDDFLPCTWPVALLVREAFDARGAHVLLSPVHTSVFILPYMHPSASLIWRRDNDDLRRLMCSTCPTSRPRSSGTAPCTCVHGEGQGGARDGWHFIKRTALRPMPDDDALASRTDACCGEISAYFAMRMKGGDARVMGSELTAACVEWKARLRAAMDAAVEDNGTPARAGDDTLKFTSSVGALPLVCKYLADVRPMPKMGRVEGPATAGASAAAAAASSPAAAASSSGVKAASSPAKRPGSAGRPPSAAKPASSQRSPPLPAAAVMAAPRSPPPIPVVLAQFAADDIDENDIVHGMSSWIARKSKPLRLDDVFGPSRRKRQRESDAQVDVGGDDDGEAAAPPAAVSRKKPRSSVAAARTTTVDSESSSAAARTSAVKSEGSSATARPATVKSASSSAAARTTVIKSESRSAVDVAVKQELRKRGKVPAAKGARSRRASRAPPDDDEIIEIDASVVEEVMREVAQGVFLVPSMPEDDLIIDLVTDDAAPSVARVPQPHAGDAPAVDLLAPIRTRLNPTVNAYERMIDAWVRVCADAAPPADAPPGLSASSLIVQHPIARAIIYRADTRRFHVKHRGVLASASDVTSYVCEHDALSALTQGMCMAAADNKARKDAYACAGLPLPWECTLLHRHVHSFWQTREGVAHALHMLAAASGDAANAAVGDAAADGDHRHADVQNAPLHVLLYNFGCGGCDGRVCGTWYAHAVQAVRQDASAHAVSRSSKALPRTAKGVAAQQQQRRALCSQACESIPDERARACLQATLLPRLGFFESAAAQEEEVTRARAVANAAITSTPGRLAHSDAMKNTSPERAAKEKMGGKPVVRTPGGATLATGGDNDSVTAWIGADFTNLVGGAEYWTAFTLEDVQDEDHDEERALAPAQSKRTSSSTDVAVVSGSAPAKAPARPPPRARATEAHGSSVPAAAATATIAATVPSVDATQPAAAQEPAPAMLRGSTPSPVLAPADLERVNAAMAAALEADALQRQAAVMVPEASLQPHTADGTDDDDAMELVAEVATVAATHADETSAFSAVDAGVTTQAPSTQDMQAGEDAMHVSSDFTPNFTDPTMSALRAPGVDAPLMRAGVPEAESAEHVDGVISEGAMQTSAEPLQDADTAPLRDSSGAAAPDAENTQADAMSAAEARVPAPFEVDAIVGCELQCHVEVLSAEATSHVPGTAEVLSSDVIMAEQPSQSPVPDATAAAPSLEDEITEELN